MMPLIHGRVGKLGIYGCKPAQNLLTRLIRFPGLPFLPVLLDKAAYIPYLRLNARII